MTRCIVLVKEHFFLLYLWLFLVIFSSNAPIMLYNISYWWFFLSQGNWWTKCFAHPKIQKPKPCLLMFASLVTLDGFHLLLSTQLMVDLTLEWSGQSIFHPLSYIYKKNSFLLCWNSCKQHSESSTHCCFGLIISKHLTHFEHSFFIDNSSSISYNFNLRLNKTSLGSFLVFSGITAEFW